MKNTKKDILDTARKLFNEKGYDAVTMRMIASALSISVGNLTYHYPKKEDIVSALLEEDTLSPVSAGAASLNDLKVHLKTMIDGVKKNSFFFTDPDLQARSELSFRRNQRNVDLQHVYLKVKLEDLKARGYFIESFDSAAMDDYIEIIMLAHLAWARETGHQGTFTDLNEEEFVDLQLRLLKPWFTEKALSELKNPA